MKTILATTLLLVLTGTNTSPSQETYKMWPARVIERYPALAVLGQIESRGKLCQTFAFAQREIRREDPNSDFYDTGMERICPEME